MKALETSLGRIRIRDTDGLNMLWLLRSGSLNMIFQTVLTHDDLFRTWRGHQISSNHVSSLRFLLVPATEQILRKHLCGTCGREIFGKANIRNPLQLFEREWRREIVGEKIDPQNKEMRIDVVQLIQIFWTGLTWIIVYII